jgi:hypothetical protein
MLCYNDYVGVQRIVNRERREPVFTIVVSSDLMVVGSDPESADLDNPRGEIIRERFFLLAEDKHGNRRRYGCYMSKEEAESLIDYAPPVAFWDETHPAYGSRAYQQYGESDDIEAEARMEDHQTCGVDRCLLSMIYGATTFA